jgi:glycosyltransferase involved in cell wall biosynthesis
VVIASRRWWHSLPRRAHAIGNSIAFRLAHRVVANSPSVAASLRDSERLRADRIAIVPNFVDDAAFEPLSPAVRDAMRREIGVPARALVVGIVARLNVVKDHASLIRAASQLADGRPELHVVIVGEGELRAPLEALASELGVASRVHFTGLRPNEPNLHHLFDVSVLCSLSEGFPNTIVEAMAAGRPVVATAVGGNVDAIVPGETGLLVPPSQPQALAAAIDRLLAEPAERRRMGEAGRLRARAHYHRGQVIPGLESLYESLVRSARAR